MKCSYCGREVEEEPVRLSDSYEAFCSSECADEVAFNEALIGWQEYKRTLNDPMEPGEKEDPGPSLHKCPFCGELYEPRYSDKEDAPEGTIWKEQHISGICSDECWNEFLPSEEPQEEDDFENVLTPPEKVVKECPDCGHDLKQKDFHDELAGYLCPKCGGGGW